MCKLLLQSLPAPTPTHSSNYDNPRRKRFQRSYRYRKTPSRGALQLRAPISFNPRVALTGEVLRVENRRNLRPPGQPPALPHPSPLEHSVVGVVEFSACSSLSCTPAVPSRVTPCLLLEDHCDDDGRTAGGGSGASKHNLKKQQQQLPAGTRMAKERERGKVCCDGAQPSGQSNTKGGPAVFVAACGTFPGRV